MMTTSVEEGSVRGSGGLADMLEKHVEKEVLFPEERLSSALALLLKSLTTASLPMSGWRVNLDHEVGEGLAEILFPTLPAILEGKSIKVDTACKAFLNPQPNNPLPIHADTPPSSEVLQRRGTKLSVRVVVTFPVAGSQTEKEVIFVSGRDLQGTWVEEEVVLRFNSFQYISTSFARMCNSKEKKGHEPLKHGVTKCPPSLGICLDVSIPPGRQSEFTDLELLEIVKDAAMTGTSKAKWVSRLPMELQTFQKAVGTWEARQSQISNEVGIFFSLLLLLLLLVLTSH